jgi:glycosyltransferase involved in cell wall biosynthesis
MKSDRESQVAEEHFYSSGMPLTSRPIILVFSDFFLPGYKSGGGMRTLVNIVDRLGDHYDFRIVTRDHDGKTDKTPYSEIRYNEWGRVGNASVRYLAKDQIRLADVKSLIREVRPDAIYLNSYFSTLTIFVLVIRKFGGLRGTPIIIAPQGELSDGCLGKKRTKKSAFLRFASSLHLYRDIFWRTTSDIEAGDVKRAKGRGGKVFIAADLPPRQLFADYSQADKPEKPKGSVRLAYLSRIHPIKNLIFLLDLLGDVSGDVVLDVYGPIDAPPEYVNACRDLIAALPNNIHVTLHGGIDHEKVVSTLIDHHFFVLPSQSENFGHVFIEAMSAGCPLIISDRTPWVDLEMKGVGWDISLEDRAKWIGVISRCVEMDQEVYAEMSANARQFAEDWVANDTVEMANREVFESALSLKRAV